jgi:hypothetical protein
MFAGLVAQMNDAATMARSSEFTQIEGLPGWL